MANRFWVLGTGNTSDTAHWSATTGGAGGQTVPVAGDTVTFDSNSCTAATVPIDVALSATSITINKSDLTLIHNAGTTLTGAMTLTAGTVNTNGQTCSWGSFSSSNSNTRTLTMGASAITLTIAGDAVNCASGTLTITANTATITTTNGNFISTNVTNWNGLSLVFTGNGGRTITPASGGTTFANIPRAGAANKTDSVSLAGNIICTGTCTLGGNSTQGVNRMLILSNTVGTQRTITAAAYVITGDVNFMDINLAYSGGASWTNVGSAYIGDALGNAGAVTTNATVSATQTATGTASFTWSTHGWTSRVPLPQDDVVINNAFVAGQTVTIDMPRLGRNITWTGATGAPTWNGSTACVMYGNLTMAVGVLTSGGATSLELRGRGTHTITTTGCTMRQIAIWGPGGTYTLQDGLTLSSTNRLWVLAGTFNANGFNIAAQGFEIAGSTTRTVNMCSGTWTVLSTGTMWNAATTTGLTLVPGTATIDFTH